MGQPAARLGDLIKQDSPHCHAPIHPPAPVPTPAAHPAVPLPLVSPVVPTVFAEKKPVATVGTMSTPCLLPGCVPGGPGIVVKGSSTVFAGGFPVARVNDPTMHPACVAPIPAPVGKVLPPGAPTVLVGG